MTVPPGDAEALAGAISRLRDDPDAASQLASAGRRFAADHLREDHVDALERVLFSAAGRSA